MVAKNQKEDKSISAKGRCFSNGFCFQWYISIRCETIYDSFKMIPKVYFTGKYPQLKEPLKGIIEHSR